VKGVRTMLIAWALAIIALSLLGVASLGAKEAR
jgi:hypothetical protein